jgi:mannose-6-phosphate isomerase-like protein (cupin superfamily)
LPKIRRRSLIHVSAGASALTALAQSPEQQNTDTKVSRQRKFFAVEAGASRPGRSIEVSGRQILVKASGEDTGGEFALFEVPARPGAGPPLHMHHIENEYFFVLDGELDVQVGEEVTRLKAGGSAYAPRMIPHTSFRSSNRKAGSNLQRSSLCSSGMKWRARGGLCRPAHKFPII